MENSNTFDPRRFVTRVGGADYLEVKWRVYWLRSTHPDASIHTELLLPETKDRAVFKATVSIPGGGSSTGWGSETVGDFRDYLEKAETKALGRALAALGFGTQFTPDFDFDSSGEKVVDAPVRLARQRQLVDMVEDRQNQRAAAAASGNPPKRMPDEYHGKFEAPPMPDDIDYDTGPPDDPDYAEMDARVAKEAEEKKVLAAAADILGADMPVRQQGMDMPRGRGYPSDDDGPRQGMTNRQKEFLLQLISDRTNLMPEDFDAEANALFGCDFEQLTRRDASAWIERITGKSGANPANAPATINQRVDGHQSAQDAPERTEAAQTTSNTPQAVPGNITDKQRGKIWFDAKEKLQLDADSPEFNDLMVLRYGVALPMLTKVQASELIKLLGENPQVLRDQLPKDQALAGNVAQYWMNRISNASSPIEATAIKDMIRGRYSQIEKPYGDLLAEELKRLGVA